MVLDTIFHYYIVDPGLGVEMFFEKVGRTEYGGTEFEIGFEVLAAH